MLRFCSNGYSQFGFSYLWVPPGVLRIWGELLFIFREQGSTGKYFREAKEQAHNFGDLGSLAKKQKNKEKPPFCLIFSKFLLLLLSPRTPLVNSKCVSFRTNLLINIDLREKVRQLSFLDDFFPLKLLGFRLVITYFGTPRLHQITPFMQIFFRRHAPGPP